MAKSSFDYFRKNSKFAVILLGVLCIMAFVVADPLMQWMSASQTGGAVSRRGEVAVTWDGGELTEGELGSLVSKRNILVAFLRQVEQMGAYQAVLAGAPANLPTRVQPLRLPTEYDQGVETDVLQKKILAQAALDAGMVIGDETIVDYLVALGRDRVDIDTMREMISGINLGRTRATPEFLFNLLREALLAQSYLKSYTYAQATITPEQRWSDWLKVNDRVVVETASLDVSDFVDQVEDPTDSVLKEYFEEYRDVIASPTVVNNRELPSPTPGFRKPAKAKLQHVRTDYATALAAARDEVTDEEIAEYYEANKAQFVKLDSDLFMSETELEVADEPAETDSSDEPMEGDSEAAAEPSGEPAGDEPDDDEPAGEESASGDSAGNESSTPAADPPAEESPAAEDAPESAPEQSSGVAGENPFRLVSFQEDPADDQSGEAAETEAAETEATDAEATDAEVTDAETTDSDSAEPAPEGEPESSPFDEFMAGGDDAPAADEPAGGAPPTDEAAAADVQYQPLEEVADEIRESLARRKAVENQQQKIDDLLAVLKNDYNVYFTKRIDAEAAGETPPKPADALVNFEKLAQDNGLEYGETDLLSFFEMRQSKKPELRYYYEPADRELPLASRVFGRSGLELYEPDMAYDTDRNFYLVMKIEELEENEPTLDDVRDEVVTAWKRQQAAKLALAKAEELAKQASESGRSLKDQFGDDEGLGIEESDMFAWLEPVATSATGMYGLRLDDPGSVEGGGPEFMEEVFSLGPNEVGAALDHGHDHALVIRVAQREKSRSELRQAFLREWQVWPGIYSMHQEHLVDATRAVVMDLLGGEEPDWKRTPNVSPMDREAAEGA